jgi:hypothetical protein
MVGPKPFELLSKRDNQFSQTALLHARKGSDDEIQGFEVTEREKLKVHTSIRRSVVTDKKLNWSSQ